MSLLGSSYAHSISPPDKSPTKHSWLNAQAFDAGEEDELGKLLRAANTFDEFVSRLKEADPEATYGSAIHWTTSAVSLAMSAAVKKRSSAEGSADVPKLQAELCLSK